MEKRHWIFTILLFILAFVALGCRMVAKPEIMHGDNKAAQKGQPVPTEPAGLAESSQFESIFDDLGREDPFLLLPEEKPLVTNSIVGKAGIHSGDQDLPALLGVTVRGIYLGAFPQALVEEKGAYRKVKPGDPLAGGRVVRIASAGVTVLLHDIPVTLKMGE